ncbi:hypothetical protein M3Y95_00367800 [Aphelenchoides besseyi]|nr:hypothetical protein M3Y95_00367800 [Aphelenchoides besseyi]
MNSFYFLIFLPSCCGLRCWIDGSRVVYWPCGSCSYRQIGSNRVSYGCGNKTFYSSNPTDHFCVHNVTQTETGVQSMDCVCWTDYCNQQNRRLNSATTQLLFISVTFLSASLLLK